MKDWFSGYHPIVNLIFYIVVLGITMIQMQAGLAVISLICSMIYFLYLKKMDGLKFLALMIFVFIVSAMVNPLFSHRGNTLLFYLFTGNPVTLESIVYGIFAAIILVAVLVWFGSFNMIITTDKIVGVIGKVSPHIALFLNMVLRFIPKFSKKSKAVIDAQRGLGEVAYSRKNKLSMGIKAFSITTTWALENSIDTADSLRARGYGVGKRTNYDNYIFEIRDGIVLAIIIFLFSFISMSLGTGKLSTIFYPTVIIKHNTLVYIMYGMLCLMPVIINIVEEIRWHRLKSKI